MTLLHRTRLAGWFLVCVVASLAAAAQERAATFAVERVIDGDTIVVETIGTVRLIGVDTPESVDPREPVQYFARESTAFLRSLLDGRRVRLDYDWQRTDRYNRTLAYVYLIDETFVNYEIVRQGYSSAYVTYPFRYKEQFQAAEREARAEGRGLWADDPTGESAAQPLVSPDAPARVWVNTSSRVYHCSGTRYFGNTARGQYMTESEARQAGHRPAYGRPCGALPAAAAESPSPAAAGPGARAVTGRGAERADVKVWVNSASRVYHCPGTQYYGKTRRGAFMSESAARAGGNRPAAGRACS